MLQRESVDFCELETLKYYAKSLERPVNHDNANSDTHLSRRESQREQPTTFIEKSIERSQANSRQLNGVRNMATRPDLKSNAAGRPKETADNKVKILAEIKRRQVCY
jgi:hypothetical protein